MLLRTLETGEPAAEGQDLVLVGVYRRVVHASLTRIWENVLDWEHLPWLHSSAFLAIELIKQRPEGWQGRVTLPPRDAPSEALVDVELDRPNLRYTTRTLAGVGTGTDILTLLEPTLDRTTRITVEFRVPRVDPSRAAAVGDAYIRLYTQLWDEDEAMMTRRQALLDGAHGKSADVLRGPTPVAKRSRSGAEDAGPGRAPQPTDRSTMPIALGPARSLRERLPLLVEMDGRAFRVVDVGGQLVAHATICPHLGGPLEDAPVQNGVVTCPWHGYRWDVSSGKNVDGRPLCLEAAPVVRIDPATGDAFLSWSR